MNQLQEIVMVHKVIENFKRAYSNHYAVAQFEPSSTMVRKIRRAKFCYQVRKSLNPTCVNKNPIQFFCNKAQSSFIGPSENWAIMGISNSSVSNKQFWNSKEEIELGIPWKKSDLSFIALITLKSPTASQGTHGI